MGARGIAFVTPHAVHQFQARIAPHLDFDAARDAILDGLAQLSNSRRRLDGSVRVRVRRPYPFRAVVMAPPDDRRLPAVVTILRSGV